MGPAMRVLMVTEDIPAPQVGGLGKHVVTLGNALLAAGHAVSLLGRRDVDFEACRAEIGFHGRFIPGFDFKGMGWKEAQLGAWLPLKRQAMARRVEQATLQAVQALQGAGAAPDVIHYHGHLPMVGAGLPPAMNFVQTRHDQGSECITHLRFRAGAPCQALDGAACAGCIHPAPGPLRRAVSALAVRQYRAAAEAVFAARKTIFVSDFLRRQFLRAVPGARLGGAHVIHNFIDLAQLRRAAAPAAPVQAGRLLLVGRLDEAKGFAAFLAALLPLLGEGQEAVLVGDGPLRAEIERRHAGSALRVLGWRPNTEVLALTRSAHVCVVPSVWEEPCATTILEALVLGRPVLALGRGGTPELARYQRYAGQLVLADDIAGLAALAAQALRVPPQELPLPDASTADVGQALAATLAVYAVGTGLATALPTGAATGAATGPQSGPVAA